MNSQVSYGNEEALFESGRFMYWTEDSRMHVAVDDNHYSYYAYDYSGERRIKLTGDNSVLDVNADYMRTISTLENVTLYPSAYMVLTDRGYTKHYYTGMERVAARIGDGGLDVGFYLSNTDSLHARANRLFSQSLAQVNGRVLEANDVDCIMDGTPDVEELGIPFEEIPEQMSATVWTEYGEFVGAMHLVSNAGESPEVYYYHGDHLGSASWITDASGTAVQHLQYLPFGERFVDQRTSGYSERFTFTGKERDEETGYGYFGARYMDHELMTSFISVDRYADKYPFVSPYAYCLWNPIRSTDPTGDTVVVTGSLADKCVEQLNSEHLKIQRDAQTSVLSVSFKGRYSEKDLTKHEAFLYQAINSTDCRIEVTADRATSTVDRLGNSINTFSFLGSSYSTNEGGSNMGVEYISSTNTAIARSFVDPILLLQNGYEQGVPHELIEAYLCALKAIAKQSNIPIAYQQKGVPGTNPDIMAACNASVSPRVEDGQIYQFGPKAGKIK